MTKLFLIAAGALGAGGVVLGAFGAHALRATLEPAQLSAWETAVYYQLFHAVALLAVGLAGRMHPSGWMNAAGGCLLGGVVLFSGSLYVLALGGPGWLGPVTPFGGLMLTAAWVCVVVAAFRSR